MLFQQEQPQPAGGAAAPPVAQALPVQGSGAAGMPVVQATPIILGLQLNVGDEDVARLSQRVLRASFALAALATLRFLYTIARSMMTSSNTGIGYAFVNWAGSMLLPWCGYQGVKDRNRLLVQVFCGCSWLYVASCSLAVLVLLTWTARASAGVDDDDAAAYDDGWGCGSRGGESGANATAVEDEGGGYGADDGCGGADSALYDDDDGETTNAAVNVFSLLLTLVSCGIYSYAGKFGSDLQAKPYFSQMHVSPHHGASAAHTLSVRPQLTAAATSPPPVAHATVIEMADVGGGGGGGVASAAAAVDGDGGASSEVGAFDPTKAAVAQAVVLGDPRT